MGDLSDDQEAPQWRSGYGGWSAAVNGANQALEPYRDSPTDRQPVLETPPIVSVGRAFALTGASDRWVAERGASRDSD